MSTVISRLAARLRRSSAAATRATGGDLPAVSVVINTLDRCDRLERTLESLRHQTYPRFEVIVVNGPSTDGTDDMLRAWVDLARVGTCDVANLGVSRNIGIDLSAGEIVAFIDDDAIPEPDWLEHLLGPYSDARVGAAGGPVFDVPLGRVDWKLCTCTRLGSPVTDAPGPLDRYLGAGADPFSYLAGCNMSFRRHVLEEIGGFNALLTYVYDDVEACCRLIDRGHLIGYNDKALVHHERAPSAVRDDDGLLLDPYPIGRSRAVFAMQCEHSPHTREEIVSTMRGWAQDWRNLAALQLAEGKLDDDGHARFVERATSGIEAGLTAGEAPRAVVTVRARRIDEFRPFPTS